MLDRHIAPYPRASPRAMPVDSQTRMHFRRRHRRNVLSSACGVAFCVSAVPSAMAMSLRSPDIARLYQHERGAGGRSVTSCEQMRVRSDHRWHQRGWQRVGTQCDPVVSVYNGTVCRTDRMRTVSRPCGVASADGVSRHYHVWHRNSDTSE